MKSYTIEQLREEFGKIAPETKMDDEYISVNEYGVKYIKPMNAVKWFIDHLEKKEN